MTLKPGERGVEPREGYEPAAHPVTPRADRRRAAELFAGSSPAPRGSRAASLADASAARYRSPGTNPRRANRRSRSRRSGGDTTRRERRRYALAPLRPRRRAPVSARQEEIVEPRIRGPPFRRRHRLDGRLRRLTVGAARVPVVALPGAVGRPNAAPQIERDSVPVLGTEQPLSRYWLTASSCVTRMRAHYQATLRAQSNSGQYCRLRRAARARPCSGDNDLRQDDDRCSVPRITRRRRPVPLERPRRLLA